MEGALFCDQCHVALTAISVGTKKLGTDDLQAGSDKLDDEHIIFLHVQGYEDPITVQVQDRVVLGRSGGSKGDTGHVNLDGYGAEALGVSRRHAGLFRDEARLYLSDLGSTNSTFLNGKKVNQGEYIVIRDGDEIRLGHLNMRLFFK
jgi:hypothetical protein